MLGPADTEILKDGDAQGLGVAATGQSHPRQRRDHASSSWPTAMRARARRNISRSEVTPPVRSGVAQSHRRPARAHQKPPPQPVRTTLPRCSAPETLLNFVEKAAVPRSSCSCCASVRLIDLFASAAFLRKSSAVNFSSFASSARRSGANFNLTEVANAPFAISQSGVSKHIKDLEDELGRRTVRSRAASASSA